MDQSSAGTSRIAFDKLLVNNHSKVYITSRKEDACLATGNSTGNLPLRVIRQAFF